MPETRAPKDVLEIIVVYWNPSDFPGQFIARAQWNDPKTGAICAAIRPLAGNKSLELVREAIRLADPGKVHFDRTPGDDPVIVETWL